MYASFGIIVPARVNFFALIPIAIVQTGNNEIVIMGNDYQIKR